MNPAISVLIAEDNDGHATLMQRNLRRAGLLAEFVHLRDGQELLDYIYRREAWEHRRVHGQMTMLLDLNMPRLGGFEVLRRLKTDKSLARIPVFVLTTTDSPAEIDHCYKLGAAACLVKPVDYGAFGAMIQRLAEFLMTVEMPPEMPIGRVHDGR
jgi:CheY-like chemotaxis protein